MKIIYDENKCIGCGACAIYAPEIWHISNKTGKAQLIGAHAKKGLYQIDVWQSDIEIVEQSMLSCPTKAILLQ